MLIFLLLAADLSAFDVNFVVVTSKATPTRAALEAEVDILNKHFISAAGEQLVAFRFKSMTSQDEVARSGCGILELIDRPAPYSGEWLHTYKACQDVKVRDPKAINFLIYDAFSEKKGLDDVTSKGGIVGGKPWVLIDWTRLGHGKQAPEEHEMGHAFGLHHVCVDGIKLDQPSNIMSSGEGCKGSQGGTREQGFTPEQVETIKKNAAQYQKLFSR